MNIGPRVLASAMAAFPDCGWQSFIRTPSFPHWEQNLGGRLQLNRSCLCMRMFGKARGVCEVEWYYYKFNIYIYYFVKIKEF
jgi:hypothetical protein